MRPDVPLLLVSASAGRHVVPHVLGEWRTHLYEKNISRPLGGGCPRRGICNRNPCAALTHGASCADFLRQWQGDGRWRGRDPERDGPTRPGSETHARNDNGAASAG